MIKKSIAYLVISLLLMTSISPQIVLASSTDRLAEIVSFSGEAKVVNNNNESSVKVFDGMKLSPGDIVVTGKNAWVKLNIDNNKDLVIGENTRLELSDLSGSKANKTDSTSLKLWAGQVWTNIKESLTFKSKYEIKTPTSVAGVRGTKYLIEYKDNTTRVGVMSGVVKTDLYERGFDKEGKYYIKEKTFMVEKDKAIQYNPNLDKLELIEVKALDLEKWDPILLDIIKDGLNKNLATNDSEKNRPSISEGEKQTIEPEKSEPSKPVVTEPSKPEPSKPIIVKATKPEPSKPSKPEKPSKPIKPPKDDDDDDDDDDD